MNSRFLTSGVVLVCTAGAMAGPLTPPPGPIDSTYKTLTEVAPRTALAVDSTPVTIVQPGSYYLTGDILSTNGTHGIEIRAHNVTLDLNGFTVNGNGTGSIGVYTVGNDHITVKNGVVTNWTNDGLNLGEYCKVENVKAISNGGEGFDMSTGGVVVDCHAVSNTLDGFDVTASGVFERCVSRLNGGDGFFAGTGSTLTMCASRDNTGDGFDCSTGASLRSCTSRSDDGNGIDVGGHGSVTDCQVTAAGAAGDTTAVGINVGFSCTVIGCVVNGSQGTGISGAGGSVVESCSVTSCVGDGIYCSNTEMLVKGCNSNNNGGYGIRCHRKCSVIDSNAHRNVNGIGGRQQCVVRGCNTSENDNDGIVFLDDNSQLEQGMVVNCTSTENGGEGIQMLGSGTSHVEGCFIRLNGGRGIQAGGVIVNCTVRESGTVGILTSQGSITNCVSTFNGQYGIDATDSSIQGCTSNFNGIDGIYLRTGNLALDNTCKQNTGSGIRVFSSGNRLERNHAYFNGDYGIEVTSNASNFLMRNTAGSNTTGNYLVQTQTDYGTITTANGQFSNSNSFANYQY